MKKLCFGNIINHQFKKKKAKLKEVHLISTMGSLITGDNNNRHLKRKKHKNLKEESENLQNHCYEANPAR